MYTQISKEPHWSSGTVLESHVLRRLREENFKVCLGYRPSSVPAWQHSKTLSGNKNIVQWSKALLPGSGLEFDSQCHKRKGNEVSMLFQKSDVSLVHLRTASLRPAWATKWGPVKKKKKKVKGQRKQEESGGSLSAMEMQLLSSWSNLQVTSTTEINILGLSICLRISIHIIPSLQTCKQNFNCDFRKLTGHYYTWELTLPRLQTWHRDSTTYFSISGFEPTFLSKMN